MKFPTGCILLCVLVCQTEAWGKTAETDEAGQLKTKLESLGADTLPKRVRVDGAALSKVSSASSQCASISSSLPPVWYGRRP